MTTGSGSTITIPNGSTYIIYCDGTNYYSASNYVSSNVSITGGTINGTTIGATTPSTGAFTTLSASSTLTASSNATVGGTLGVTGNTTLSGTLGVTGNATFSGTIAGTLASTVTGTTQSSSDNSTKIATTAYVTTAVTTATGSLGTMSTQNANAVAITGGTITNNVVTTLGEVTTVLATAATGTVNYDVLTQSVLYYTTNASGNWTLNIRGNSGTTLNSVMGVGETRTITFLVTQGSTAYYNNALTIDGNAVSPKWQGGAAPTLGDINSIDTYTYSIIKTASATFTVLASQSQFK